MSRNETDSRSVLMALMDAPDTNFLIGADHLFDDTEARVIQSAFRLAASQPDREAVSDEEIARQHRCSWRLHHGMSLAEFIKLREFLLSGASAKSAPCFKASHNSGERDPSVMPDCRGADTKSDGGERSYCRGCGNQSYDNKFGCSICDMDAERPSDPSPGSDVSLSAPVGEPGQSFVLRPISTAPRDGTPFIAIATTKGWRATKIARFLHAEDRLPIPDGGGMWPSPPTHWTQLPVITLIPESDESPSCADSGDLIAPPAKIPGSSDPSPGPDVSLPPPVGEPVAFITKSGFKNWLQGDGPENHVLLRTGGDLRVALYTHPVAWECVAQRQSLPEPADCDWPVCGCDPHANKVIESLEEQGVLSTHPPAPAVGPDVREVVAYQMVGEFASPDFPSVNITPYKHVANLWRQAGAEVRELYALTRPLGGSAQGSIATKQSSSSTPATATETSIDALEPWRDELAEIVGHLGAAIIQSTTSDDQIIMDHVKAAHEIAKIVRRKA